jgi:hypothetical protein
MGAKQGYYYTNTTGNGKVRIRGPTGTDIFEAYIPANQTTLYFKQEKNFFEGLKYVKYDFIYSNNKYVVKDNQFTIYEYKMIDGKLTAQVSGTASEFTDQRGFTHKLDIPKDGSLTSSFTWTNGSLMAQLNFSNKNYKTANPYHIPPDKTPPVVGYSYPMEGDTNVKTDTTFTMRFSEPIKSASLWDGYFALTGPDGSVKCKMKWLDAKTVQLELGEKLKEGEKYTLKLFGGMAADTAGNKMEKDYIVNFTTEKTTGVGDTPKEAVPGIEVYPNPTDGKISIDVHGDGLKQMWINLYDLNGNTVDRIFRGVVDGEKTIQYDLDGNQKLPTGVYYVGFGGRDGNRQIKKVVKE